MRQFKKIKLIAFAIYNFLKLVRNPASTDHVLAFSDKLLELGMFEPGVDYLKADPRTASLVDRPHSIPPFDLDQLLRLPEKTLGHEFAVVMKAGNFDPNYFRRNNPDVKGKVILDHIKQTHDIWHIVLGLDTSILSEIEILSFEFNQLRAPQAAALMAGAIMRYLFTDFRFLPQIMEAIARGWKNAESWPPLFAVNWAEIMHLPVEQIRSQLDQGIIPTQAL